MVSNTTKSNVQRKIKIQKVPTIKTKRASSKRASNALMKKSLNDALVLKDGFNIRTSLTPCKYILEACPYFDTSLSSTRQALEQHEL